MWTPAMRSARSVAASIAFTVSSRSVMTPLRKPVEGASPTPMMSRPLGVGAATTAHVLVVPMSKPTIGAPHPDLLNDDCPRASTIYCGREGQFLVYIVFIGCRQPVDNGA